jgi:L-ascorbate metabolism protein UlaG (beta-lactamase superfamily)
MVDNGFVVCAPRPASRLTEARGLPGVTRLQHAGLLFPGRGTGILVDPHLHSTYEPTGLRDNLLRHELEGLVDAIVISHSHPDHFHVTTLMTFGRDVPLVVPRSRRATMLCPDFAATLRALGFRRVVELDWYDPPFVIGDLEVQAFPFFASNHSCTRRRGTRTCAITATRTSCATTRTRPGSSSIRATIRPAAWKALLTR